MEISGATKGGWRVLKPKNGVIRPDPMTFFIGGTCACTIINTSVI